MKPFTLICEVKGKLTGRTRSDDEAAE